MLRKPVCASGEIRREKERSSCLLTSAREKISGLYKIQNDFRITISTENITWSLLSLKPFDTHTHTHSCFLFLLHSPMPLQLTITHYMLQHNCNPSLPYKRLPLFTSLVQLNCPTTPGLQLFRKKYNHYVFINSQYSYQMLVGIFLNIYICTKL